MHKLLHVRKDCGTFIFASAVGKVLKTLNLSPMADDTITLGDIWSGISLVYLWE